jgi:hypothetical protein
MGALPHAVGRAARRGVGVGPRRRGPGRPQRDALPGRRANRRGRRRAGRHPHCGLGPDRHVRAAEGRAATTVARGAPSRQGLEAAHAAVVAWSRANGHELTGTRWEVYDTTGATTRTRSRPRSTGCSPRDALTSLGPLACCGRVLSADHAPQTPQAPSEAVSAATRPSTVFARPGTTARVAIRERLLPSRPQLLRRVGARLLSAGVSRHRGLPPPWRANGCAGASLERQEAALGATGRQPTCAAASTPKRKRRPGRRRPPSCIDRSNQRLPPAECSRQACCCDPRCR